MTKLRRLHRRSRGGLGSGPDPGCRDPAPRGRGPGRCPGIPGGHDGRHREPPARRQGGRSSTAWNGS
ncbi:MAG: hypothetical protein MZU97_11965 [Bacillus subtilis]|nr:hypothetical protein [Bacillus subtilis]